MKIGFTGTQQGMTDAQVATVASLLQVYQPTEFHHGDCIGADTDADAIVRMVCPEAEVHVHPPIKPQKRAFCKFYALYPEKDYISRNHDIVDAVKLVIATPEQVEEQKRSGTWATIRYSRKKNVQLAIVWPDGSIGNE